MQGLTVAILDFCADDTNAQQVLPFVDPLGQRQDVRNTLFVIYYSQYYNCWALLLVSSELLENQMDSELKPYLRKIDYDVYLKTTPSEEYNKLIMIFVKTDE